MRAFTSASSSAEALRSEPMNAASAWASALRGEKPSSATFDCISVPAGPMPSKVPSAARSSANASVSVAPFTTRPGETPLSSAIIFAWYESAERMSPALASGERLETPGTVRSAGTTCAQSTLPKWAFRCVQASPTAVARSAPFFCTWKEAAPTTNVDTGVTRRFSTLEPDL